jgi:tRNA(Ile)-lysidine synthase
MMISDEEAKAFAAAMAALGPFEPAPHIAVAVSGGSDSLALLLLLRAWLRAQGGRLTALSVDHGLRPEAAAECRQVGDLIARLNQAGAAPSAAPQVEHHILTWRGEKPAAGLMAAAREARYHLLTDWCRCHDVLHLGLAHHADDQVETVLMRAAHGSGASGLAGMTGARCTAGVRLLRPLLGWHKQDLVAIVKRCALPWIEDPSNQSERFERVRWRRHLEARTDMASLLADTVAAGRRRDQLEREAGLWLAQQGRIDPHGYVVLPLAGISALTAERRDQVLRQVLEMVGAARFPPPPSGLAAVIDKLQGTPAGDRNLTATLGGCRLVARGGRMSVFREADGCDGPLPVTPGKWQLWDRRFQVRAVMTADQGQGGERDGPVTPQIRIAAIGKYGLRGLSLPPSLKSVPIAAREALPGLWLDGRLRSVGEVRTADAAEFSAPEAFGDPNYRLEVSFLPARAATSCAFTVVTPTRHTM